MEMDYKNLCIQLFNKGYTVDHLLSLPKVITLPDDIMIYSIIPHLYVEDMIKICFLSKRYIHLCLQHKIMEYLYNRDYKSDDFLSHPFNHIDRIELLIGLNKIKQKCYLPHNLEQLYNTEQLRIDKIIKMPRLKYLAHLKEFNCFAALSSMSEICSMINIKKLTLNNNIFVIPDEIGNMVNLQTLNLTRNQIANIPSTFTNLTKLYSLNLNNNKIINVNIISQMTQIGILDLGNNNLTSLEMNNLTNLYTLDIEHNQLTDIPFLNCLINLNRLDISHNHITTFPDIDDLPIKKLYMNHNRITSLPTSFKNLTQLQYLAIDKIVIPDEILSLKNIEIRYHC